jgi:hypothetical protein
MRAHAPPAQSASAPARPGHEIGARCLDAHHAPGDLLVYGVIENLLGWFGLSVPGCRP